MTTALFLKLPSSVKAAAARLAKEDGRRGGVGRAAQEPQQVLLLRPGRPPPQELAGGLQSADLLGDGGSDELIERNASGPRSSSVLGPSTSL